ncbi:unnamed protein product [Protopolystoma xenopodis]|uniref:Uncharacterized protein n=1 Tax=Protopolystoma xenopodis TaxID=117903 RepID=A0A448WNG9_9PLAT|nr:unnamed protein product [Protopolystoma xenopodis]
MKKRFVGRSHQKRMDESRCTAAVWLLCGVQVDAVNENSFLVSGENELSFRSSNDGHHQSWTYRSLSLRSYHNNTKSCNNRIWRAGQSILEEKAIPRTVFFRFLNGPGVPAPQ